MHDRTPLVASGLVFLYIVAVSLSELIDREQLRRIGVGWFGERVWKLIDHNLTLYGIGAMTTGIYCIIISERWSPEYIFGLCMMGLGCLFFTLAIIRTGFFESSSHPHIKTAGLTATVLTSLLLIVVLIPSKRVEIVSRPADHDPPAQPPTEPFNTTFRMEFINTSKRLDIAPLWLTYSSAYGQTMSPVAFIIFFDFISRDGVSIAAWKMSVKTNRYQQWTVLDAMVLQTGYLL